ncbi:MAG: hypothetical protein M3Q07_13680 [Pseudobdellovibrionaceae bacterium]|nr:hypothetical protein [Pseudobdellovibrionaceae bacterium]
MRPLYLIGATALLSVGQILMTQIMPSFGIEAETRAVVDLLLTGIPLLMAVDAFTADLGHTAPSAHLNSNWRSMPQKGP